MSKVCYFQSYTISSGTDAVKWFEPFQKRMPKIDDKYIPMACLQCHECHWLNEI